MSSPPIDMVVHCPRCALQHIDEPDLERGWTNPPHRSHLCAACGFTWRPADVCTNGVLHVQTSSKLDTPTLPVVVLLRPGPRTTFRERFAIYEVDPPGSRSLLLVVGNGDCNVVNGAWTLEIDAGGRAHRGNLGATLLGYIEDQKEYITGFGGGDPEAWPQYGELLEAFQTEMDRRAAPRPHGNYR